MSGPPTRRRHRRKNRDTYIAPRGTRWVAAAMYPGPWRHGRYVGGMGEPTFAFVAYADAPAALPPAPERTR